MRRWVLIAAGATAGIAAWYWLGDDESGGVIGDVRQAFRDAISGIVQGRRLTHCPYDKTTGVAPCPPEQLAEQAGLDLETYALARQIASEEGNSSTSVQALVAHATKNEAARRGISIASLLTQASTKYAAQHTVDHGGRFGTQKDLEVLVTNAQGDDVHPSDRYASTATDPYEGHAAIAAGVLSGAIPDLTGGANQFDRPSGESDPDRVAQKRTDAGSELVTGLDDVQGIGDLRFWRISGGDA